jgi:hypothetical protein
MKSPQKNQRKTGCMRIERSDSGIRVKFASEKSLAFSRLWVHRTYSQVAQVFPDREFFKKFTVNFAKRSRSGNIACI